MRKLNAITSGQENFPGHHLILAVIPTVGLLTVDLIFRLLMALNQAPFLRRTLREKTTQCRLAPLKTRTIFLLIFLAPFLCGAEISTPLTAEESAQKYMTAFFHGDLETATALCHPETLENLKKAYLQQIAIGAIPEKEFRNQFGVPDEKELGNIDPKYLFIKALEFNQSASPPGFNEAAKKTTVTIKSNERIAEGLVKVVLTVVTPTKTGEYLQETPIYVKEHDGKFLVVLP